MSHVGKTDQVEVDISGNFLCVNFLPYETFEGLFSIIVINDVDTTKIIGRLNFILRFRYNYNLVTNGHVTSLLLIRLSNYDLLSALST